MSDDLVFYTHPMSRGRIVRWMLEEVGQPYQTEILDFDDSMKTKAYRAVNPMGKVPAIAHNGKVVTEAAAICAYLADAFPQAGLAPAADSPDRADYYRWMFFAAGPFEAATTNRILGWEPAAEQHRMVGYGSYDDALNALESAVSGREYIAGDRFTAADLYVGAQLGWSLMTKAIPPRPEFVRYAEAMRTRPAAIRAAEIDDKLAAAGQGA